jgi:hypothetical protein
VSEVGHGRLGGRSNLRTWDDLVALSAARKDTFLEYEGGRLISGTWSAVGSGWSIAFTDTFRGAALCVISARTLTENLVQAETSTDCVATDGTFFHRPGTSLFVRLSGGVDPNDVGVRVTVGFGACTGAPTAEQMKQPILGQELLLNPDYETWTTSTNAADWTEDNSGAGWSNTQETTIVRSGSSSLSLLSTGAAAGSAASRQNPNITTGLMYRLCGYYFTPVTAPASQHAYVRYGTTLSLAANGRSIDTTLSTGYELTPTLGYWRFFIYDFLAHEDDARIWLRLVNGSAVASSVYFDKVSLKQIFAWRFYFPRLAEDGIPGVEMGAEDIYPGSESTGGGTIKLLNDEGILEEQFSPPWFYLSRDVRCLHGGVFQDDGQEILYNDMEPGFSGIIAGDRPVEVSDEEALIQVEDQRAIMSSTLPTRSYNVTDFPNMETRDIGRPRPLVFGLVYGARATRINVDGTTGYGIYEILDTTDWADGFLGVGPAATGGAVWAYESEEAAEKHDASLRVELDPAIDYASDLAAGTTEILTDIRIIRITRANNKIDFDVGAGTVTATIATGVYIIGNGNGTGDNGLLEVLAAAMLAAGGVAIDCEYQQSTHLVVLTRPTKGTFSLLWNTGADAHVSIGPTLGYDGQTDDTGLSVYAADSVLFTDPDSTHIPRFDIAGFKDDGSGTYTGTPGDVLQKAPDILRFILLEILKIPSWRIDLASFLQARSDMPETLGIYLGALSPGSGNSFDSALAEVIDSMEAGSAPSSDIVMDGSGVFHFNQRTGTVPSGSPHLRDHHYIDFRGFYEGNDVYGTVRVNYAHDPVTRIPKTADVTAELPVLLYGRQQLRPFDTFLVETADAEAAADFLAVLARAAIRRFEFTAQYGPLLRAKVGDLIRLTRSRALQGVAETGGLNAAVFRILYMQKDFVNHVVRVVCHTNVLV